MLSKKPNKILSQITFFLALISIFLIFSMYFYNIFQWRNYPDFGFGWRTATGVEYIGQLTRNGRDAGMQLGDRFVEVNSGQFKNILEFRSLMNRNLGDENTYLLDRNGRMFAVTVKNVPSGIKRVLQISGLPCAVGLGYVLIGILVFFMNPHRRVSWIFFFFTSVFGLFLVFLRQLSTLTPFWLENIIIFAYCFTPAVFIQLAFSFPEERQYTNRIPYVRVLPYGLSSLLFILIRSFTPVMASAPRLLTIMAVVYMAISVIFFLGSNLQLRLTSTSEIVKLRSSMILLGFAIAASVPLADLVVNALFGVYIIPAFNFYLPFFIVFPVFVGYSIVKHDLFDIDAIIKRTYGYLLTTGAIATFYGLLVLGSNLLLGSYQFTKSPVFPLIFILLVVLMFNHIRDKIQVLVDTTFYRLEFNYQETVQQISETMRSLLNLDQIGHSIMAIANETMFIDSGCVMLRSQDKQNYECLIQFSEKDNLLIKDVGPIGKETSFSSEEEKKEDSVDACVVTLGANEALLQKLIRKKGVVTLYDIQEESMLEGEMASIKQEFDRLDAVLIVPLIYEEELTGFLALGHKKSGKFYRKEDINLLTILANQSAVAVENAFMLEEIVEKERAKAKLMDVFGKYVTDEIRDQILNGRIPLDGETKDVTLLFADLRGFTTLAESTPPKDVVKIINSYFSGMAKAIRENQGLVLQFIGDEIEAVFGAPVQLEDHPTHAVKAAFEMRKQLEAVNAKLQEEGYQPLRHGIGVHTGKVVAANIGSEDRLSYAMVGDTVNVASRIQGLNKEFGTDILISITTKNRLSDDINLEKLPATTVKGKKELVEVFKVA